MNTLYKDLFLDKENYINLLNKIINNVKQLETIHTIIDDYKIKFIREEYSEDYDDEFENRYPIIKVNINILNIKEFNINKN